MAFKHYYTIYYTVCNTPEQQYTAAAQWLIIASDDDIRACSGSICICTCNIQLTLFQRTTLRAIARA
eukprot:2205-Heterococcus_DN1.PRE.3